MGVKRPLWIPFFLILAGCASLTPLPPAPSELTKPYLQLSQVSHLPYIIGPEDVLKVTLYSHPELSQEVVVSLEGWFVYPLIGKVEAAGATIPELAQRISQRLEQSYLIEPQLALTMVQSRHRHVRVIGEVRSAGIYPQRHNATLVELLSTVGGLTSDASWYAMLARTPQGPYNTASDTDTDQRAPTVTRIDLDKLFSGTMPIPIRLQSGDTIYVPKRGNIYIAGEVAKPGRYRLEREMSVLQAVILAGGFTQFAVQNSVKVRRFVNDQSKDFLAGKHDLLQNGDVVTIPKSIF